MEASLRMRLDHGLPLTPELLGFVKDIEGKLVANSETQNIPKLMFYMYLYAADGTGYADQGIQCDHNHKILMTMPAIRKL